VAGTLALV